jgi:hypothetical protein
MNRKISREVATQGVRSGDGTNWRDEPMFVRVGELTEHPERAGNERVPSVLIRLQTLDDCLRSVGDTFEIPFASECEFVWPVTDRELGEPFVPGDNLLVPIEPSMAFHEHENGVVQGTSQVVKDVSNIKSQFGCIDGRLADDQESVGFLLERNRVGVFLPNFVKVLVEDFSLIFRAVEFGAYPDKLRVTQAVDHDLPLEEDAKQQRQRAEARDPAENALVPVSLKAMAGA